MTNNGIQIMKLNNQEACLDLGITPHIYSDRTPSENVPHLYSGSMDTRQPGYGYNTSDLKNPYLSREQLQSRYLSPSIEVKTVENKTMNYHSQ
jgi:hypothetical protein